MSQKEKIIRRIKSAIWLLFSIICYVLFFCFLDYDWVCILTLSMSLIGLVMIIVVNMKKIDYSEISNLIKNSIYENPMSLDNIKKEYHFAGINSMNGKILRIYFNSDNTKRCLVVQESNAVRLVFEEIMFLNDDAKLWNLDFAYWTPVDESNGSLYADEKLALKDNVEKLKGYKEEKYTQICSNKYIAEVWWKIDINSPLIPFASYNRFHVSINGEEISDVIIHNTHWFDKNTSIANLYFNANINKSFKFKVLHEGKVIATGKHYKNN